MPDILAVKHDTHNISPSPAPRETPAEENAHNLYSFKYDMAGREFDKDNLILSDLPSIQSDKEYTDIHTIADSFENVSLEYSNGIFKSDWKLGASQTQGT